MLINLVIGKMSDAVDLTIIPGLDLIEMGDWESDRLPTELHQWVDLLDDSNDNISLVTTNASIIHAALLGKERILMENIWLILPFYAYGKQQKCRKLVDILERDWLAHFCIADLWMTGRLQHDVNEALEKEKP
jgi:hypothetical protein